MTTKSTVLTTQRTSVPLAQKRVHYQDRTFLPVRLNLPARLNWLETALFDPPWGALNSQIRPSVSAGGVLHSRTAGMDVEEPLCSRFREA